MTGRTVVAGIGNVFLGDDGFGVEVVARLVRHPLPGNVQVMDVGIRGVHLAYDLLDGCDLLVLVDAASRGLPPGTLSVLELEPPPGPGPVASGAGEITTVNADAHAMTPDAVLNLVRALGGTLGRTLLVACEPAEVGEAIGLSTAVQSSLDAAVGLVLQIVEREEREGDGEAGEIGADRGGGRGVRRVAP